MTTTAEMLAFSRGVRPVVELVFPEKAAAVLGFRPAPELQARIEELAARCTEGQLTQTEREEEQTAHRNPIRLRTAATGSLFSFQGEQRDVVGLWLIPGVRSNALQQSVRGCGGGVV